METPTPPDNDVEVPDLDANDTHTDRVRALFEANPHRVFRPKEVLDLVDGLPANYVGPLMKRLHDRGELVRVAYGRYRIANGDTPEDEPRETINIDLEVSLAKPVNGNGVMIATSDGRVFLARELAA